MIGCGGSSGGSGGSTTAGVNSGAALIPLGSATVTEAATDSTIVTVAAIPAPDGLVVGAMMLLRLPQPFPGMRKSRGTLYQDDLC